MTIDRGLSIRDRSIAANSRNFSQIPDDTRNDGGHRGNQEKQQAEPPTPRKRRNQVARVRARRDRRPFVSRARLPARRFPAERHRFLVAPPHRRHHPQDGSRPPKRYLYVYSSK